MFSIVRTSTRCACICKQQSPWTSIIAVPTRNYQNPNTNVFERLSEVNPVAVDRYPLLKRRHYIYKKVPHDPTTYSDTMKCILTREIEGIGLKGTVVEVKKRLFRNILYPRGDAVYASPDNLKDFDTFRKDSVEEGIDYEVKMLMIKLAGLHLPVYMNSGESWTLDKTHLRIALRKVGVYLSSENILPPMVPVNKPDNFAFKIQINDRIATKVRGTVYNVGSDCTPDPRSRYSSLWGNPPIDGTNHWSTSNLLSQQRKWWTLDTNTDSDKS